MPGHIESLESLDLIEDCVFFPYPGDGDAIPSSMDQLATARERSQQQSSTEAGNEGRAIHARTWSRQWSQSSVSSTSLPTIMGRLTFAQVSAAECLAAQRTASFSSFHHASGGLKATSSRPGNGFADSMLNMMKSGGHKLSRMSMWRQQHLFHKHAYYRLQVHDVTARALANIPGMSESALSELCKSDIYAKATLGPWMDQTKPCKPGVNGDGDDTDPVAVAWEGNNLLIYGNETILTRPELVLELWTDNHPATDRLIARAVVPLQPLVNEFFVNASVSAFSLDSKTGSAGKLLTLKSLIEDADDFGDGETVTALSSLESQGGTNGTHGGAGKGSSGWNLFGAPSDVVTDESESRSNGDHLEEKGGTEGGPGKLSKMSSVDSTVGWGVEKGFMARLQPPTDEDEPVVFQRFEVVAPPEVALGNRIPTFVRGVG